MVKSFAFAVLLLAAAPALRAQDTPLPDTLPKSKASALAANLLWPGLGSFVAYKNKHAAIHALVPVVAFTGAIVYASNTPGRCRTMTGACESVLTMAMLTITTNTVWSMVTAANDVDEFNRRLLLDRSSRGTRNTRPFTSGCSC